MLSRSAALVDPTKTGLTAYDRMMNDLESTCNKFVKQLDKALQEAQEARERERVMNERLAQRMEKKRAAQEAAVARGKKVG